MNRYFVRTYLGAVFTVHELGASQMLEARLRFQKPERAAAILEGRDEATNADLAAFRALGTKK